MRLRETEGIIIRGAVVKVNKNFSEFVYLCNVKIKYNLGRLRIVFNKSSPF